MAKVFVESYGCAANFGEGEMISGILKNNGFVVVDDKTACDVIILNVCTVKGNNVALRHIRKTSEEFPDKRLIIAGCVPSDCVSEIKSIAGNASVINTHNVHRIVEVVHRALNNSQVQFLERTKEEKILFPKLRNNPLIGIISISQGCDSACSFCSVKFIKGNHVSYAPEKVISDVKCAVSEGCKEIWITGQDTGCYGLDFGKNLPWLLKQLVLIEGDFKIRLGMANPKHVKDYVEELIDVYKSCKLFKFLHIPVQSGNDNVLSAMKRGYCVNDFKKIIASIRDVIPEITLSTDIICGFPGETVEQFNETLNLVKDLSLDVVNISRFALRPGTFAAKMSLQISSADKKVRSKEISNAFVWSAYERNKFWIGWAGEIVINEKGRHDCFIGRNFAYKPVVVKGSFLLGQKVNVKITGCASTHLLAELTNVE